MLFSLTFSPNLDTYKSKKGGGQTQASGLKRTNSRAVNKVQGTA